MNLIIQICVNVRVDVYLHIVTKPKHIIITELADNIDKPYYGPLENIPFRDFKSSQNVPRIQNHNQ